MSPVNYAQSGREWFNMIHSRIEAVRETNALGTITVVMPSYFSAFYTRRRLIKLRRGLFNVDFVRVDDIASMLVPPDDGSKRLTRLRTAELVRSVLESASVEDLGPLQQLQGHPSLAAALHIAFDELRPVSEDGLNRISEADPGVTSAVVRLWRAFSERTRDYADQLSTAELARDALERDPQLLQQKFGVVIVGLLETPVPQHVPLIEYLATRNAADLVVGMAGVPALDAGLMAFVGHGSHAEFREVEGLSVSLVSVPEIAEEVRTLVRRLLAKANEGVRFGDMAVIFQDPSYAAPIIAALSAASIPTAGADPRTLADTPEGRFALRIFGVFDSGFSRESVADWLNCAPIRASNGSTANTARWDLISRTAGVVVGQEQWSDRLLKYSNGKDRFAIDSSKNDDADDEKIKAALDESSLSTELRTFLSDLANDPPPQSGSWAELSAWLKSMMARYLRSGDSDVSESANSRLVSILDRVAELDEFSDNPPSLLRFQQVLADELARSVGPNTGLARGVLVTSVRDVPGVPFAFVSVLGMREGAYPTHQREGPLLPDRVRESESSLADRSERDIRGHRRFLNAIAGADERMFLWPRADSGGARRGPSRWFLDAARLHDESTRADASDDTKRLQPSTLLENAERAGMTVVKSESEAWKSVAPAELSTEDEYSLRSISALAGSRAAASQHWIVRDERATGLKHAFEFETGRYAAKWSEFDGDLSGGTVEAPSAENPISPSRLETWAACPFKYFAGSILGLSGIDKPEQLMTISSLDRGSMVHKILELYVSQRIGRGRSDIETEKRSILVVAESVFAEYESRGVIGKARLWAVVQARIHRELVRFVEFEIEQELETGFLAKDTEMSFGFGSDLSDAITLDLGDGQSISFRGFIDRIEESDDGRARVVDYKTGKADSYSGMKDDALQGGRRLQLPIYALAARRKLKPAGDVVGEYWFTSESGKIERKTVSLDELESDARNAIRRIITGIGEGVFPAIPGEYRFSTNSTAAGPYENCSFCDFDPICPVSRQADWDKKRRSSGVAPYFAEEESE